MPALRYVAVLVPGPTNMLQIKRFVAWGCVLMHLVSTGCASASYAGGSANRGPYIDAKTTSADMAVGQDVAKSRSFESVSEMVVTGATGGENEYWSGGDADDKPMRESPTTEPAPPPPPPPGPAFPGLGGAPPTGRAEAPPKQPDPASTTPSGTGKKEEPARTQVAAGVHAPMLIYTGHLQMAVYEVRSSLNDVEALARSIGGFLSKRDDRSITIRVPAASFEDALRRIEKLGDMISRDVQVEDVTEEFNDVEIRLKNARAVRDRLEQLLAKASKVEESIQIERELERVALVIERLEGRMKFLRDRASYSTITVTFSPRSAAELGKRPFNLPVPWLYDMGLGRLLAL
jgi:hypothetical protein